MLQTTVKNYLSVKVKDSVHHQKYQHNHPYQLFAQNSAKSNSGEKKACVWQFTRANGTTHVLVLTMNNRIKLQLFPLM